MLTIVVILVLYLFLSGCIYYIIRHTEDRSSSGKLTFKQILLFFGLKIVAGCAYGYIYKRFYNGDDTWHLNSDAFLQYQRLIRHPGLFISDLFSSNPTQAPGLWFQDLDTYPERLEFAFITKIMAPFNLVSQGNYYINIVFFSFLTFWGAYFIYKLLLKEFITPTGTDAGEFSPISMRLVQAAIFLFPPLLFWLSGYRGDGLLLLFAGLLLYYFREALVRPRAKNILIVIISFIILFIVRNVFALVLLPVLAAWWISRRYSIKPWKVFTGIYTTAVLLVALSGVLPTAYQPLRKIAERQQAFFILPGNTRFNLTPLSDSPGSFLAVAPEALVNTLLRPWPWEAKGALQWLVAGENILLWALIILCLVRYHHNIKEVFTRPLAWVLLCAALTSYLLTGYIVPFPGAIVRYRAIPELFLLCLLAEVGGRKSEVGSFATPSDFRPPASDLS
jgi:hypothetical protein